MVDGRRRVKDLQSSHPGSLDVGAALEQLETDGFIVRTGIPAPRPGPKESRDTVAAAPPPPPAVHSFEAARAMAVRLLQEAMGRDAGNFAPRLEACANGEELLATAERYAIVIGSVRNKGLGDSYLEQVRAALKAA